MSERTEYAPGEFCWVDLATTDVDGAKAFYDDLLGVQAEDAPGDQEETGGYGFLMRDGKMVAGIGPVQSGEGHSAWASYIKVEDTDATAAKVKDAGGSVFFGPVDLPNDSGRVAMLRDPEGAFIGIIQQERHPGAQIVNELGAWTWNNLLTRDPEGAKRFYGDVFGWTAIQNEEAPPGILMWQVEGQRWPEGMGGLMELGAELPAEMPPHWQVYFVVDDADQAIERAEAGGATLAFGPIDVPVGRLATLVDPQGAAVSIFESHYPEPR
ncbi:MAG TPA: VOC family protein [Solirubrobacterales bacterium]|nr:VOC family protein [Solirubrobacterales bacterium]